MQTSKLSEFKPYNLKDRIKNNIQKIFQKRSKILMKNVEENVSVSPKRKAYNLSDHF